MSYAALTNVFAVVQNVLNADRPFNYENPVVNPARQLHANLTMADADRLFPAVQGSPPVSTAQHTGSPQVAHDALNLSAASLPQPLIAIGSWIREPIQIATMH